MDTFQEQSEKVRSENADLQTKIENLKKDNKTELDKLEIDIKESVVNAFADYETEEI